MALSVPHLRASATVIALAVALGCGSGSSPSAPSAPGAPSTPGAPSAPSAVSDLAISSRVGDGIGNGQQVHLTASDSRFRVQQIPSQGALQISIDANDNRTWWQVWIGAPAGQALQAGVYENSERYTSLPGARPRLTVNADGRGCDGEGRFTITNLTHRGILMLSNGTSTPALYQLVMSFEHRCRTTSAPGLTGTLTLFEPTTFG
jgi:hypothetical protein